MSEHSENLGLSALGLRLKRRIEVSSFRIRPGECVVLCGPNGSGKSSLLRVLAGLEEGFEGKVALDGKALISLSRRQLAGHIAWLPQRPHLSESLSCAAIVAAARFRFFESKSRAEEMARQTLSEQGIAHLADRMSDQVSGGELQRVLVAALVAQNTPYLLVDEPANHLDPRHQLSTYEQLGRLWREAGKAILLVSHDVRLARLLGPAEEVRIIGVKEGRIHSETHLDDSGLSQMLSSLYEVPFVDAEDPGGLSVEVPSFAVSPSAKAATT